MRILHYASIVSPHQMPLWDAVARLVGDSNLCYYATMRMSEERRRLGWGGFDRAWLIQKDGAPGDEEVSQLVRDFDVLVAGAFEPRVIDAFIEAGKPVLYPTERWFKPPWGMIPRLLRPGGLARVRAFRRFLACTNFYLLAIGPWAAYDALRVQRSILGLGQLKMPAFDRVVGHAYDGYDNIRQWGYFVLPAEASSGRCRKAGESLKALWVGRMLGWKRVKDLIKAIACLKQNGHNVALTLIGQGPKLADLKRRTRGLPVEFKGSVPIHEVREAMRAHDVYVLPSSGYEGWGAVVSEALEEGMRVIGTRQAGSCAAMLPDECLYDSGDVNGLVRLLSSDVPRVGVRSWTAEQAARWLVDFSKERVR